MLNRSARLVAAAVITLLSLPAAAGSWPNIAPRKATKAAPVATAPQSRDGFVSQPGENMSALEEVRYFTTEEKDKVYMPRIAAPTPNVVAAGPKDFEYIGGEAGWKPTGHKFVWSAGRFAHSEDCDHAIRTVKAPTPAEMEATNRLSPGA